MADKLYYPLVNAFVIIGDTDANNAGQPVVLQCFPKEQEDEEVVKAMPMLCFPEGTKQTEKEMAPSFMSTTLTLGNGDRHYAFCLSFSDTFPEDQKKSRPLNTTKAQRTPSGSSLRRTRPTKRMPEDHWKKKNSDSFTLDEPSFLMSPKREGKITRRKSVPVPDPASCDFLSAFSQSNIYSTKGMVILSKFPYYQFYKEYLSQIYEFLRNGKQGECQRIPIEHFVSTLLHEILIPPRGNGLRLSIEGPISPLYISSSGYRDLPLLDISLRPLLLSLHKNNIIKVFTALCVEWNVLFISSNTNLLYYASTGMLALLYPLEWQTTFIPIIPPSLLELTQAPNATVLGIPAKYKNDVEFTENTIVVDLDNNEVSVPCGTEELPELPSDALIVLRKKLDLLIFPEIHNLSSCSYTEKKSDREVQEEQKQNDRDIRLCFLAFFVYILRNSLKFINVALGDTDAVFDINNYIQMQVTSALPFWQLLLNSMMFQILTQKYASEELRTSFGLFTYLCDETKNEDAVETFEKVLHHYRPVTSPKILTIPVNSSRGDLVPHYWNPCHFPVLVQSAIVDASCCNEVLLKRVNLLIQKNNFAPLYVYRAHLIMQRYRRDREYFLVKKALFDCSYALVLEPLSVPHAYIYSLLYLLKEEEFLELGKESLATPIEKMIHEIIESKDYSVHIQEDEEEILGAEESGLDREEEIDAPLLVDEPVSLETQHFPSINMAMNLLSTIKNLKVPVPCKQAGGGEIPSHEVIRLLQDAKLIPDDPIIHEKLIIVLQSKNDKILPNQLIQFLHSMKKVLLDCKRIQSKYQHALNSTELALLSSSVAISADRRGHIVLTSERVLFFKGEQKKRMVLADILNVEAHTYHIMIPGGVPSLSISVSGKKPNLFVFYSSWSPSNLRDIWVRYISDMAAAWKMCATLKDKNIITMAVQNLILSAALSRRFGSAAPLGNFQYFGSSFPSRAWFRIPPIFLAKGIINISSDPDSVVCGETKHPLQFTLDLLQKAIQLVHVYSDGVSIDFNALKESGEYLTFKSASLELKQFSIDSLSGSQLTVLFVNLYNTLLLHAYMVLGAVPSSIWEWKYLERSAYYSIAGTAYSLWDIHHGILRGNKPYPNGNDVPFYEDDPRLSLVQKVVCDPRLLFTLSNHTTIAPFLFKLEPASLSTDLLQATNLYVQNSVTIQNNEIFVPFWIKFYAVDFMPELTDLNVIEFLKMYITVRKAKKLDIMLQKQGLRVVFVQDWTFSPKVLVGSV